MKSKNTFNFTLKKDTTESKLLIICRDDYNKRGGALGNIDCTLEGELREIPTQRQDSNQQSESDDMKDRSHYSEA